MMRRGGGAYGGGSNENWRGLVRDDPDTAQIWDAGFTLPDPGTHTLLDAFYAAKHITRDDLARTGARLTERDGDVLLFAWPGGAKFRNLETGRRWTGVGAAWRRAHIIDPYDGRAGTVLLAAEGETDAARLHRLYPFASVAVLPLGAEHVPPEFPAQCAAFDAVYACHDADAAGDAGAVALTAVVPQVVRHRPPEFEPHNDWCAFPAGVSPPPLPKPPDACGSIVFEDFGQALATGVPEPVQLIQGVLYDEGVHWLSGEPDSGKTTLAAAFALQSMCLGLHVVWLDFEGGLNPSVRRFAAVGLGAALASSNFHYAGWPVDPEGSLAAVAARWPGALIVFDSASKAQSAQGVEENDNTAVTAWTMRLVRAAKQEHLSLVVIDHISKGAQESRYARGAGSKQADTDVHWRAIKVTEFDRNNAGCVMLVRKKDREGYMPAAQWFAVGDGAGGLPVAPCDPPAEASKDEESAAPRRPAF